MTQYAFAPDLAQVGTLPAGWTNTWATNESWTVVNDGTGVAAFRGGANTWENALLWTSASGPGQVADCQIYLEIGKPNSNSKAYAVARGSVSSFATKTGYLAGLDWYGSSGGLRIREVVSASATNGLATLTSNNDNFTVRTCLLVTVSGGTITAKQWNKGADESTASQTVTTTAATAYASGYVGISEYLNASAVNFYFIGVGTGISPAPRSMPTPSADLAQNNTGDASSVVGIAPVLGSVAQSNGNDASSVAGKAPVRAVVTDSSGNDVSSVGLWAGGAVRLRLGIYLERGAWASALTGLRWKVFSPSDGDTIATGTGLSTDGEGVAIIDLSASPYQVGDYVPVMVTQYDSGVVAYNRTVRAMFGFVPAIAIA